jgi:hypothetical protein
MVREATSQPGSRLLSSLASRVPGARAAPRALTPDRPPIEKIASDARRLHKLLETLPPGTSFVRASGVGRAYDYVLAIACEQLEVSTRILELPEGKPRILERLRVEFLLGECGLQI